jgi:predicted transcriptional regulator
MAHRLKQLTAEIVSSYVEANKMIVSQGVV